MDFDKYRIYGLILLYSLAILLFLVMYYFFNVIIGSFRIPKGFRVNLNKMLTFYSDFHLFVQKIYKKWSEFAQNPPFSFPLL